MARTANEKSFIRHLLGKTTAIVAVLFFSTHIGISIGHASEALANGSVTHPEMERRIQHYVNDADFRGVILVAQHGRILHRASYGWADEAAQQPNRLDTRFLIGSLTKSFTAMTVMRLVEAGKLELHTPLSRYIPALRSDLAEGLTLHRLLKHQSGLPVHLERLAEEVEKPVSSADILKIINTGSRHFAPGSQHEYGNLNYHLAAIAIEQVTGLSFADAVQQQIFQPLNMHNSGVERFGQRAGNRANGYSNGTFGISQDENNVSLALGSGDIYSTVDDLYRWDQALANNSLLSATSRALLFKGENEAFGYYGYGFRTPPYLRGPQQTGSGKLVRHGGSMDGFLSNYHRYLDDELTVMVLGNFRPFYIRQLTFELKEIALGAAALQRKRPDGQE